MIEVGELAGTVVPFLSAAAGAYGSAVVAKVSERGSDAAADATVGVGRRLLDRLLASRRSAQVGAAVTDLGENPDDDAFAAAVFAQVKRALAEDAELAEEIAAIVAAAPVRGDTFTVTVTNSTGVQVGNNNVQSVQPPPAAR
ncbi:hypothetical protein [Actinoplanes sp. NPDC049599]|uniref:hypothetical protein n=1 Tax=Actinoplanes sp. NPDC049599 TaxID=3363903 RepID=UPI00379B1030